MALEFAPFPTGVRYRRAPLASVLCQIRFSPIFSLATDVGVAGFQEAIRSVYPEARAETDAQIDMAPNRMNVQQSAPVWRFTSADGNWRVSLGVDFVALETPQYTYFDDFLARLNLLLQALERTVHPGKSMRIGLRKVNQIHRQVADAAGWADYVNRTLLGAASLTTFPAPIVFSFADLRFQDGDCELAVRHGLHPGEESAYVIDMDYWTAAEYEIAPTGELSELLAHFSHGMTSFFHFAAESRLLEEMEPYAGQREV